MLESTLEYQMDIPPPFHQWKFVVYLYDDFGNQLKRLVEIGNENEIISNMQSFYQNVDQSRQNFGHNFGW